MITPANRASAVNEYYFSRKMAQVKSLDTPELPVINLGIGNPDMPPHPAVIEALCRSAFAPGNHGYQSYKGIDSLRQAMADYMRRIYRASIDPAAEILPLIGSKEGITHVTQAFVNPGEIVLVPDPGYPTYEAAAKIAGAEVLHYEMDGSVPGGIDLDALEQLPLDRVKLMWINFPHMPTGMAADKGMLEKLIRLTARHNILLVNDNPYSMILNPEPFSLLSLEGAMDNCMELNSLSKSHNMAGWRIGWLSGGAHHISEVLKLKSQMDSGMFLPLQHAAIVALELSNTWFERINKEYADRKSLVNKLLSELGCELPEKQVGMFVWAKVPDAVLDVETWLDEVLLETKLFITPGFVFGPSGKRFLRISLCSTAEKLHEAIQRIMKMNKGIMQVRQLSEV
jgi:aspartate/methionine/tyrosine aminotransferase